MISSLVSSSSRGDSSTPSAGMQYRQRRLQRSVSEMRRYVCMRLPAPQKSFLCSLKHTPLKICQRVLLKAADGHGKTRHVWQKQLYLQLRFAWQCTKGRKIRADAAGHEST